MGVAVGVEVGVGDGDGVGVEGEALASQPAMFTMSWLLSAIPFCGSIMKVMSWTARIFSLSAIGENFFLVSILDENVLSSVKAIPLDLDVIEPEV